MCPFRNLVWNSSPVFHDYYDPDIFEHHGTVTSQNICNLDSSAVSSQLWLGDGGRNATEVMLAPSCRMPSGGTRVQLSHRQASSRTSLVSGAAAANVYVAKLSFVISILGEAPQNNIYILFPVKLSIYSVWTHGLLLYFMGYIRLLSFSCFRLSQVWPAGGLASWLLYPFSYAPIASKDKYLLALRHNMMLQAHLFHVPQSWNQPRLLLVTNGI